MRCPTRTRRRRLAARVALWVFAAIALTGCADPAWTALGPADVPATDYFTADEIASGKQYGFERLLFSWGALALSVAYWSVLLVAGLSKRFASWAERWTRGRFWLACLVFFVGALLLRHVVGYPLSLWRGYFHLREWGLSNLDLGAWHVEKLKSIALSVGLMAPGMTIAWLVLRRFPRRWWIAVAGLMSAVSVVGMFVWPLCIAPLFNTFTRLEDGPLRDRLVALVERSGVSVEPDAIFVVDGSRQSHPTNAYVVGIGASRRIVLYDTLIANHDDAEVESVLAHEIGHDLRRHIWKGLGLGVLGSAALFFVMDRVLALIARQRRFGVRDKTSLAAAPVAFLVIGVGSYLALPVQNAISRHFERQADDTELELTGRPDLMISSRQKMGRTNRSDVEPHSLKRWFYYSHPTILERIRRAEFERRRASGSAGSTGDER